MLNFDQSTVKHALQNTQNDCHQWLSDSSRVHQIRFWPWWSLQRSPRPRSWFKGALLLRGSKEKDRGRGGEEREREMKGRGMKGDGKEEGK